MSHGTHRRLLYTNDTDDIATLTVDNSLNNNNNNKMF